MLIGETGNPSAEPALEPQPFKARFPLVSLLATLFFNFLARFILYPLRLSILKRISEFSTPEQGPCFSTLPSDILLGFCSQDTSVLCSIIRKPLPCQALPAAWP